MRHSRRNRPFVPSFYSSSQFGSFLSTILKQTDERECGSSSKRVFVFAMGLVVLSYFTRMNRWPEWPAKPGAADRCAFGRQRGLWLYQPALHRETGFCAKGGETFTALTIRAKEGARVAYEFLDKQLAKRRCGQPKTCRQYQAGCQPRPAAAARKAGSRARQMIRW